MLPRGNQNLLDALLYVPPKSSPESKARVNGQIRALVVRVIGVRGGQLGVMAAIDALKLAQSRGIDLVEIAAHAKPPVCRLVDYGKFRYEMSKQGKEHK